MNTLPPGGAGVSVLFVRVDRILPSQRQGSPFLKEVEITMMNIAMHGAPLARFVTPVVVATRPDSFGAVPAAARRRTTRIGSDLGSASDM